MWDGLPFCGSKIALLAASDLLIYQRDDITTIPYPGLWDLPGGGREGSESPFECVRRETLEEFDLSLSPDDIVWVWAYPPLSGSGAPSYFFIAEVNSGFFDKIVFGDEGQGWKIVNAKDFLQMNEAVGIMKDRLRDFYSEDR